MNADGSNQHLLLDMYVDDKAPSWSKDGSKIVFSSWNDLDACNIYTVNADGSGLIPLTHNTVTHKMSTHPAWSPDGSKIAYSYSSDYINSSREIYIMNANGSNPTKLTTVGGYLPRW